MRTLIVVLLAAVALWTLGCYSAQKNIDAAVSEKAAVIVKTAYDAKVAVWIATNPGVPMTEEVKAALQAEAMAVLTPEVMAKLQEEAAADEQVKRDQEKKDAIQDGLTGVVKISTGDVVGGSILIAAAVAAYLFGKKRGAAPTANGG